MDVMLLRLYQFQVAFQCEAALAAFRDLHRVLAQRRYDAMDVWIAVENIVGAAANISKALWGQGEKFAKEREPLRISLEVKDDSPLRSVAMRNHFEHFDERLDEWWRTSKNHNYLDWTIADAKGISGLAEPEMFRVFDPKTFEIVFWGQRVNLNDLAGEAARLSPLASAEATKPHW